MGQESPTHLPADPWREHFKLFDSGWFFLIPLSPPFLLLLVAASLGLQPLPMAQLPGTRRQGGLGAALTGCLHTQPSFTPSHLSGAGMFALHLCFRTWSCFLQSPKGIGCQWGGKVNSTSHFQPPAPHITHNLFKCSPEKYVFQ